MHECVSLSSRVKDRFIQAFHNCFLGENPHNNHLCIESKVQGKSVALIPLSTPILITQITMALEKIFYLLLQLKMALF